MYDPTHSLSNRTFNWPTELGDHLCPCRAITWDVFVKLEIPSLFLLEKKSHAPRHFPTATAGFPCSDSLPVCVMQGHRGPVVNQHSSSGLRGVVETSTEDRGQLLLPVRSLRHPLFRIWRLRKTPRRLVSGSCVSKQVRYLERPSTSPFLEVPVPAARYVYIYIFVCRSAHRSN